MGEGVACMRALLPLTAGSSPGHSILPLSLHLALISADPLSLQAPLLENSLSGGNVDKSLKLAVKDGSC